MKKGKFLTGVEVGSKVKNFKVGSWLSLVGKVRYLLFLVLEHMWCLRFVHLIVIVVVYLKSLFSSLSRNL